MRNGYALPTALAAMALVFAPAAWTADAMKGEMKKSEMKSDMKSEMKAGDMKMAGTYTNPSEVKWGDAPPMMPKGAKLAVLNGDPGKPGAFVARLMVPANYKIAPHYHSNDEDLTIVSGELYLGEGDKMDTKAAHGLKAGGFHHLPGKAHHYAFSKTATVVQINSTGPFDLVYIDPKDDPSKTAAAPAKEEMKKGGDMKKGEMKK